MSAIEELHIYYLKGHLRPNPPIRDSRFIGSWEEEDYSFLIFHSPADRLMSCIAQHQPQLTLIDKYTIPYETWLGEEPEPEQIGRFYIIPLWLSVKAPE